MHVGNVKDLLTAIKQCRACSFANPCIAPLAPKEIGVPVKIMFIGENPSWAEGQDEPFSRETISGKALQDQYLDPLCLSREEAWITDLIKCRYPAKTKWSGYLSDIYRAKAKHAMEIHEVAKKCAVLWLAEEIRLAQPKVIVTLSNTEVYQRFRSAFALDIPHRFERAVGTPHYIEILSFKTILFPMIHPDVSRPISPAHGDKRKIMARTKWSPLHRYIHIPLLKRLLSGGEC